MRLKAKSNTVFTISKTNKPATEKQFTAIITSKTAPIRVGPGRQNKQVNYSPLEKGAYVDVLDSILSNAGNTWYYIRYQKKYGYICSTHVKSFADFFVGRLEAYHKFIKEHASHFKYEYDSAIKTFPIAKKRVKEGKTVHITCVAPGRWGMHALDIDTLIYGEDGHFKHFNDEANTKLKKITKDGPVGKTYKKAIDDGDLKKGDIVVFKGHTHTSTYSGKGYVFYDSGRTSFRKGIKKNGIKANYYKQGRFKTDKINEVLRWR